MSLGAEKIMEERRWGLQDEELASHPTVFAPDLMKDQVVVH